MTSMAMAEGIVHTANAWEVERADLQAELAKPFVNWNASDTGSFLVILLAGFVAFFPIGKKKEKKSSSGPSCWLPRPSQRTRSFAGPLFWLGSRMVCLGSVHPSLLFLSLAALLVPMATGKAIYCHQLCPHGAAQQWMRKVRKQPFQISSKLNRLLECIPYLLLVLVVFLAFQTSAHTLNILEPFDAYVWQVAGGVTITIAVLGLLASAFIPMAYCRYGCPTGAMLKLFEFRRSDNRWTRRDYLSFAFLDGLFFCTTFSAQIPIRLALFANRYHLARVRHNIFQLFGENHNLNGKALGTTWSVKIRASRYLDRSVLKDEIISTIEEAEKILSHWRPDAELYQFNQALTSNPITVHPLLHELLLHAHKVHDESAGAFDPTIAPIVNLWGFGPVESTRTSFPSAQEIQEAQSHVGIQLLEILPENQVRKRQPTVQVDLSSSAKGEIIDQVCEMLHSKGLPDHLVEIGGEIRAGSGNGR